MESTRLPSLIELFISFAKVGVMTFGGGYAMLPILEREVVESKGWCSEEDLADYFAIGQCTPGIIAVNTATFVGSKQRGPLGAVAATLGLVTPSLIIIMLIAGLISSFSDNEYVQKAFIGIRACVLVLIANAIIKLWKNAIVSKLTLLVFILTSLVSICFKLSPVIIVLSIVIICILATFLSAHKTEEGNK